MGECLGAEKKKKKKQPRQKLLKNKLSLIVSLENHIFS